MRTVKIAALGEQAAEVEGRDRAGLGMPGIGCILVCAACSRDVADFLVYEPEISCRFWCDVWIPRVGRTGKRCQCAVRIALPGQEFPEAERCDRGRGAYQALRSPGWCRDEHGGEAGGPCRGRCQQRGRPAAQPYPGQMRRLGPVTRAVISLALWPLIIIFSPVIVLAGEPVNRYVMRRVRRTASTAETTAVGYSGRPARGGRAAVPADFLLLTVISHPLWIALTAPGRWVSDRFRRHLPRADGPVSAP